MSSSLSLAVNSIGYTEPLKVDAEGHLIVSGISGGGSTNINPQPADYATASLPAVGVFCSVDGTANYKAPRVDAQGALIVRTDNSNDSIRITGLNSVGVSKGVGVEDTNGAVLGGGIVNGTPPTTTDGTRQTFRMDNANNLNVSDTTNQALVGLVDNTLNTFMIGNSNDLGVLSGNITDLETVVEGLITKGDGAIASGTGGLQQCLMYGKHSDGRLFPLESDGDRLRVVNGDVSITAQQSGNTMTQAKCFQFLGTNGTNMRTVKTDDDGNIQVNNINTLTADNSGTDKVLQATAGGSLNVNLGEVDASLLDSGNIKVAIMSGGGGGGDVEIKQSNLKPQATTPFLGIDATRSVTGFTTPQYIDVGLNNATTNIHSIATTNGARYTQAGTLLADDLVSNYSAGSLLSSSSIKGVDNVRNPRNVYYAEVMSNSALKVNPYNSTEYGGSGVAYTDSITNTNNVNYITTADSDWLLGYLEFQTLKSYNGQDTTTTDTQQSLTTEGAGGALFYGMPMFVSNIRLNFVIDASIQTDLADWITMELPATGNDYVPMNWDVMICGSNTQSAYDVATLGVDWEILTTLQNKNTDINMKCIETGSGAQFHFQQMVNFKRRIPYKYIVPLIAVRNSATLWKPGVNTDTFKFTMSVV